MESGMGVRARLRSVLYFVYIPLARTPSHSPHLFAKEAWKCGLLCALKEEVNCRASGKLLPQIQASEIVAVSSETGFRGYGQSL